MGTKIPQQGFFFYKSSWTAEVDSLLLSLIIKTKEMNKWSGSVIPIPILEEVAEVLTKEVGVPFTWPQLYERFQNLEERHILFDKVVKTNGVYWNANTNVVMAPEQVWKPILKENKLAAAYYYCGDPEFPRLRLLFGPQDIKQESAPLIFNISDTTVPVEDLNLMFKPLDGVGMAPTVELSVSVSSPPMPKVPKMKRNLFGDGFTNVGSQSNNEDMDPRIGKKYPPKPKKFPPSNLGSPHGSSCGSSNTHKY
ncbi:uncharacterized protein LOC121809538 [Salvia splendens]|nr:uncharacterized protein LOC121743738 [Salvia splendens]XP_042007109.1 uncharacterized protein LOC121755788 [Salvia splendens]XP_042009976.1 uncharacterized protein LOC121758663 [Salvia splendens]XP_042013665.1 uncharacterized protein LOC121762007 [Salvia splendens]XP_042017545.1 uncharacterized protein LOC121765445 [Salvia splendens]XP_042028900.1 uncharacterized protein LOC121775885 [Salvia splendens]XP_042030148.1 uncharacterized protein LOC121777078 [Salvia splendens]XP_042039040.1 unc